MVTIVKGKTGFFVTMPTEAEVLEFPYNISLEKGNSIKHSLLIGENYVKITKEERDPEKVFEGTTVVYLVGIQNVQIIAKKD